MIQKLRQNLNRLLLFGIENAPPLIKRKVVLANQISLSLFLIGIPTLIYFFYAFPHPAYLVSNVFVILLCFLGPFVNRKGYYNLSRISLCVLTTVAPGVLSLIDKVVILDDNIGVTMYYNPRFYLMTALLIPLLLFDFSEKGKLIFCLVLNAFFLFSFDWIDSQLE